MFDLLEPSAKRGAFPLLVRAALIHLGVVRADKLCDEIGVHKVPLQRLQNEVIGSCGGRRGGCRRDRYGRPERSEDSPGQRPRADGRIGRKPPIQ